MTKEHTDTKPTKEEVKQKLHELEEAIITFDEQLPEVNNALDTLQSLIITEGQIVKKMKFQYKLMWIILILIVILFIFNIVTFFDFYNSLN